jgi:hypothetical protein
MADVFMKRVESEEALIAADGNAWIENDMASEIAPARVRRTSSERGDT